MSRTMTGWELDDPGKELLDASARLREFVEKYPLCALRDDALALAIVRRYHPTLNCAPATPDAYAIGLAYHEPGFSTSFALPRAYAWTGVAFGPDGTIRLSHRDGAKTTNLQELSRRLAAWLDLTEPQKQDAFDALENHRETFAVRAWPAQIESAALGAMRRDQFDDWWIAPAQPLGFFDGTPIDIRYIGFHPDDDDRFIAEADAVVGQLLGMTAVDRLAASPHVHRNCIDFLEAVEPDDDDAPMLALASPDEVWRFVQPTAVYVSRDPYRDRRVYARVCCRCDWETEHGLQLVFDDAGKLVRISADDGHIHGWNGDGMID